MRAPPPWATLGLLLVGSCGPNPKKGFYSAFMDNTNTLGVEPCGDYDGEQAWCFLPGECVSETKRLCQLTWEYSICEDANERKNRTSTGYPPGKGVPCGGDDRFCGEGALCDDSGKEPVCLGVFCSETP